MGPTTEPGGGFSPRRLALAGGRWLTVRMSRSTDAQALAELYSSLDEEDLYRRFFQARVPTAKVVEHTLSAQERGGAGLVAVLEEPGGTARLVGEASFEPLPTGGADLGITVAPRSRGWLGPYLLDALMDVARARGITNLQADVLVENRRMLSLARARGYATIDHSDRPSIVRVVMGTSGRTPPWPGGRVAPRLLVEAQGGRWHGEAAARAAGFEVVVCPGPAANRRCPAVAGEPCPLVSAADVVVDTVSPESAPGRALLDAHEHVHAGVPICVEFRTGRRASGAVRVIPRGADAAAVVSMLQRLVADPARPPADGAGPT